jgi:hypothetical protein
VKPVVWFTEPSLSAAGEKVASGSVTNGSSGVTVTNVKDFVAAMKEPKSIGFVDTGVFDELSKLERVPAAVVAVTTGNLVSTIAWLKPYKWLGHVASASMLEHPLAAVHFQYVRATVESARPRLLDWLGDDVEGRRVRMSSSERRVERLERMRGYLTDKGVSGRTIEQLADIAEELLTNAFYDAPVAAGAIKGPISRETSVTLPDTAACDLAYGARGDLAIVRVKDPFGSFSRRRLVDVLTRCAQSNMQVEPDESMGGAGLGIWRIFSNATYVAVVVIKGVQTEILVGIAKRSTPKPFAFDLFFTDGDRPRIWTASQDESVTVGQSVLFDVGSS